LEAHGLLRRVREEVDPQLEMAAVHRRVFEAGGPALLFEKVKGSPFQAVSNLFGSEERCDFLFRGSERGVQALVSTQKDPLELLRHPGSWLAAMRAGLSALPKRVSPGRGWRQITLDQLPAPRCWPRDGGRFLTLPQVFTEKPGQPGWRHSNLGMYRVQLDGNEYGPQQIGMHYQLHRGIGNHHQLAQRRGEGLKVSVFLGGPPAHTLAAVMPLPEDLPEVAFAGAMAGRRFRWSRIGASAGTGRGGSDAGFVRSEDADFVICGTLYPGETAPEGPFGDHLGYYSLVHPMPLLRVESVWARPDALFPFTVVGRPPAEDSWFGHTIHKLTAAAIPAKLPGVSAVNAVDEAGVHPLLLAVGSERYVPYESRRTRELLTQANAILGFGQLSLAKYLLLIDGANGPVPDPHDLRGFFTHLLERADWRHDLHFQTHTTTDTLDYTGSGLNEGSKAIWTASGEKRRTLATQVPSGLSLPDGFGGPRIAMPGVLLVVGPRNSGNSDQSTSGHPTSGIRPADLPTTPSPAQSSEAAHQMEQLAEVLAHQSESCAGLPLVVVCDDADFAAASAANFVWVTFTRSDPARDTYGVRAATVDKHWSCSGSLLIDARIKLHHAPPLLTDPAVEERAARFFAPGASLSGVG
jgi:4-hydroxy-3-polyprenylbenzoate decarboxylase